MMTTLYLTAQEKTLFEKLSKELKEGWTVEGEEITYKDSPQRLKTRFDILNVQDPKLKEFKEKARSVSSEKELTALVREIDLSRLNNADMTEIFYALGPAVLSGVIETVLSEIEDDEGIEQLAAIATMRHLLFGPQQS